MHVSTFTLQFTLGFLYTYISPHKTLFLPWKMSPSNSLRLTTGRFKLLNMQKYIFTYKVHDVHLFDFSSWVFFTNHHCAFSYLLVHAAAHLLTHSTRHFRCLYNWFIELLWLLNYSSYISNYNKWLNNFGNTDLCIILCKVHKMSISKTLSYLNVLRYKYQRLGLQNSV